MTIGERIQVLRTSKGFSIEDLAEQLEVSPQKISEWETDNSSVDTEKAVALSRILGVTTDFLLTGEYNNPELSSGKIVYNNGKTIQGAEPAMSDAQVEGDEPEEERKKFKLPDWRILVALALVVCIIIALVAVAFSGKKEESVTEEQPVKYTYVLVHGMGGWGEGSAMNEASPYWGSSAGSISEYLRTQEIQVVEATVGPFSSAWDRACELYAQLTGTQVDYGEAHSKEHGHARFGRKYTEPLVEKWDDVYKVNLVGHSFGGNTIRLMTSLLEYGSEAEQKASQKDCSPLFKGGKGGFVHSVTTLASPHNGSTIYYCLDFGNLMELTLKTIYGVGSISRPDLIDFQLEHFGIASGNYDTDVLVGGKFGEGKDNAFYDLSPHGAKELNEGIKLVDSVYYFSYAYCTTTETTVFKNHVPTRDTLAVLLVPAGMIGAYTNKSANAQVVIDEKWWPNDGLVNVISAQYPTDDKYVDYVADGDIKSGQWYVFPTITGDHGTPIGMNGNTEAMQKFYMDHITIVDNL